MNKFFIVFSMLFTFSAYSQTITDSSANVIAGTLIPVSDVKFVKAGINPVYGWEEFYDQYGNAAVFNCSTYNPQLPFLQSSVFGGQVSFQNELICNHARDLVRAHFKKSLLNSVIVTFQGPTIFNIQLR